MLNIEFQSSRGQGGGVVPQMRLSVDSLTHGFAIGILLDRVWIRLYGGHNIERPLFDRLQMPNRPDPFDPSVVRNCSTHVFGLFRQYGSLTRLVRRGDLWQVMIVASVRLYARDAEMLSRAVSGEYVATLYDSNGTERLFQLQFQDMARLCSSDHVERSTTMTLSACIRAELEPAAPC